MYQSFSGIDGVTPLWCWAHIRRRFIRVGDAHRKNLGPWADAWVARIGVLYAAHRRLAAAPDGTSEHARAAKAFGAALDEIDAHRRIQGARPDLLHPAAAKVLATLDREWDGLVRHRDFPDIPLDNNTAEVRHPHPGSWAARTTTAPARGGPRSWPGGHGRSWAPPRSPGTTPAPT